ncbi:hypothetical protein GALMADRAFT_245068 [Galerina marginata CBS 339.88]|uniref:Uncharacterized protein n=1 Tax=Galerina marginata (strain CBS 339.88) TaxID=685588 RepID=A0A067T4M6_GALM3|nr:hypothetical protein GALMADRAFT_245068 [Galerina marginata CBS 339.88]
MDQVLAFLESPRDLDTVALARSTEKALQIIMPWCQMQNVSELVVAKDIHNQALVYAQAIDFSVGAASMGFAIAEDALTLVEFIPQTTDEERQEFLEGIKELAQKGLANAKEAMKGFVNVRTTIEDLLSKMKAEDQEAKIEYSEVSNGFVNVIRRPFTEAKSELAKGIHDLEEFSAMLSKFVAWWNLMAMETSSQISRGRIVIKNDKLHMMAIEARWKDHRKQYAAYVNEIGIVQDRYPKLFNDAKMLGPPAYHQYLAPEGPPPRVGLNPSAKYLHDQKVDPIERPGTNSPAPGDWRNFPEPGHRLRATPARSNSTSTIISEELSSSSYMSASLATVQVLEKNKCLLILQFQCHPSSTRRFTSMRIKWKFRTIRGAPMSPRVIDVAPKQSIGAKNEERHHRKFGVTIPAQFNFAGVAVGPEVNTEWKMAKTLSRAMFFTGSVRGHWRDSAEWTVDENASAMSGIPPHFCVAAVVEYGGVFMMELDIVAKQSGMGSWWSRNHARGEFAVDVDKLHDEFQEYKPSNTWQQWFPLITGEVEGGATVYPQEAVCR